MELFVADRKCTVCSCSYTFIIFTYLLIDIRGECKPLLGGGCECNPGLTGEYCKELDGSVISPAARLATSRHSLNFMAASVVVLVMLSL